jgi:hypothetical protein
VRAGIAERVKRAADVCHGDPGVLHIKRTHVTLSQIVCSAYRYELSHSFRLLVLLRLILIQEPHSSRAEGYVRPVDQTEDCRGQPPITPAAIQKAATQEPIIIHGQVNDVEDKRCQ